ncbi:MAG TPA: pyoverdine biosynthesis protein [Chromatiaceae bacterium]|nr:MAG: L-tyrosine/L-tryptophan isonitrile synthase family protein [Thiohalocapsa sp. PB-PSB1]HBG96881.1 pyoverdine biosynthesis protein [Chromatiaceae bacterium]HCS90587.1 pyoverdine biosynthesis protein [Chromatiaceae bacterium]
MRNVTTLIPNRSFEHSPQERRTAEKILRILFAQRRLLPNALDASATFEQEAAPHIDKLLDCISDKKPIVMILPGFPAKSPNRKKTLSALPDFGEHIALKNLNNLCNRIKEFYEPGARITICSDGRVFADVAWISDEDVTAYRRELKKHAREHYPETIDFFDLDDVYPHMRNFDMLREELLIEFGETITSLRQRCKEDPNAETMYRGITRFIFEDYLGIEPFCQQSRTNVQKLARQVAYRMIQRSNAWTRLLEARYDFTIRLSIHPQPRVSTKIGIFLVETDDVWCTPWHSVAVKENGRVKLLPRAQAESAGFALMFNNSRPSHYELPQQLQEAS